MKTKSNRWIVDLVIEMVKRGAEYAAEHSEEIAASFSGKKKNPRPKIND